MLKILIIVFVIIIGMILILRDNDKEIAAWREDKRFKAVMLYLLYFIRVALFFMVASITIPFLIARWIQD